MEFGKNVSPLTRKGERSYCRLLSLKSRLLFFAQHIRDKALDQISKEDIHQFFSDMRQGNIIRADGKSYIGVSYYVEDFKAFWGWLRRTGKVQEDITTDLRRSDDRKPDWAYLTEEEFKTLANRADSDYRTLMWLMYDTGMRITEAYSIRISDFSNDFTRLNIRQEYSKTFGRTISLKLCPSFIKEYVKFHNLQPEDFVFIKKPATFNKYLRKLAKNIFGTAQTLARKPYHKMRLYDIRHNASCYWLKRYPTTTGLMYRMGWSEEKEVKYYSEFLGQADSIDDENMITAEEKTKYEKEIELLKKDREKTNELVNELIKKIADMQISLKNEVQENKNKIILRKSSWQTRQITDVKVISEAPLTAEQQGIL
jgi:integrase